MVSILIGILLFVLKLLAFLLLGLVLLLLVLLLIPVRYRAGARLEGGIGEGKSSLSWLFGGLSLFLSFEKKEDRDILTDSGLMILGHRIAGGPGRKDQTERAEKAEEREKREKKEKAEKAEAVGRGAKKRPSVGPGGTIAMPLELIKAKRVGIWTRLSARISALLGRLKKTVRTGKTLCDTIQLWWAYLRSESFARLFSRVRKHLLALVRHILPRRAEGHVIWGFEDPSVTGELMALIALFYPLIPDRLQVLPDFEGGRLDLDVSLRGRAFPIVLVRHLLGIVINRDFRRLMDRIGKRA